MSSFQGPPLPSKPSHGIEDLDLYIGDEWLADSKTYGMHYPTWHGAIDCWDHMEQYWEQSIFKYLHTVHDLSQFVLNGMPKCGWVFTPHCCVPYASLLH